MEDSRYVVTLDTDVDPWIYRIRPAIVMGPAASGVFNVSIEGHERRVRESLIFRNRTAAMIHAARRVYEVRQKGQRAVFKSGE